MAISTGSGRIWLWEMYIQKVLDSPIIGYGLGVIPVGAHEAMSARTHNFIFSALIGTGFLGLSIFLVFLVKLGSELIISRRKKNQCFFQRNFKL